MAAVAFATPCRVRKGHPRGRVKLGVVRTFLHERPSRRNMVGALVAFLGITLVA